MCLELLFGLSDENKQCVVKSFLYLLFLGEHWQRKVAKRPERVGQFVGEAVWSSRRSPDHGSPANETRKGMVHHFNPNHNYLSYVQTDMEYVVVQFYPWFKFYFSLFWGMVIYGK